MPFPLVPVAIIGLTALAALAFGGGKKDASPGSDPLDPNLPPDVRAAVFANLAGNTNANELWQLSTLLYAQGYPKASQAIFGRMNQIRAQQGLPALSWTASGPPPFVVPSAPISPGQPAPPPSPPQGLPPIPPLPPSPLPPSPGVPTPPVPVSPFPGPGPTPPFVPPVQPGTPLPGMPMTPEQIAAELAKQGISLPGLPAQPGPPVPPMPPSIPVPRPPSPVPPVPSPMAPAPALPPNTRRDASGQYWYKPRTDGSDWGAQPIAARFGKTAAELMAANPGYPWGAGNKGQELKIPASWIGPGAASPMPPAPPSPPTVPIQVPGFPAVPVPVPVAPAPPSAPLPANTRRDASGQVWYKPRTDGSDWGAQPIAARFGHSAAELMAANPGYPWGSGNRGQELKIPSSWVLLSG